MINRREGKRKREREGWKIIRNDEVASESGMKRKLSSFTFALDFYRGNTSMDVSMARQQSRLYEIPFPRFLPHLSFTFFKHEGGGGGGTRATKR